MIDKQDKEKKEGAAATLQYRCQKEGETIPGAAHKGRRGNEARLKA